MFEPKDLSEIFGQDHIVSTLKDMDLGGQAIFFEGWMGTGKTSMAHILAKTFAKSIHCIKHINCGEYSKVEEMREIVKGFKESNLFGLNQCYIFDEPQLLSTKAMNCMLVPTDKLPKHLLIILCSAEPQAVAKMLPERFIRFKTRPLSAETSGKFLTHVCQQNNITLDKIKRALIIDKCEGNPRKIIKAIPKIKNIEDLKDIEYLLDMNAFDEDEDILKFFKTILAKQVGYNQKMNILGKLLKVKTPNAIRIGILNLIGNGLLRGYGGGQEKLLIEAYKILKNAYEIPEQASLVTAIADIHFNYVRGG